MKTAILLIAAFLLAACAGPTATGPAASVTPEGERTRAMLVSFLMGTWETLPAASPKITLRMTEIWKGHANEQWMYAEYERPGEAGRPFRQRIYRFSELKGDMLVGDVYGVPEGGPNFAGEWRKRVPFEGLSPANLRRFDNCRIRIGRLHEAIFAGGTEGTRCRGDRPDVAYERSEFHLTSSTMRNLEQGYDVAGKRVAGEPWAYELRRMSREAR